MIYLMISYNVTLKSYTVCFIKNISFSQDIMMMVASTSDKGSGVVFSLINSLPYKTIDGRRNIKIENLIYRFRVKKTHTHTFLEAGSVARNSASTGSLGTQSQVIIFSVPMGQKPCNP